MSDTFHNCPLNDDPQIFIIAYTVENELIFQPVEHYTECKEIRIYQFLETDPDTEVARNKAFVKLLEEAHDLMATRHLMIAPDKPYEGLKLYIEYHVLDKNGTKSEPISQRHFILDGKPFDKKMLLERLADEL